MRSPDLSHLSVSVDSLDLALGVSTAESVVVVSGKVFNLGLASVECSSTLLVLETLSSLLLRLFVVASYNLSMRSFGSGFSTLLDSSLSLIEPLLVGTMSFLLGPLSLAGCVISKLNIEESQSPDSLSR